MSKIKNNLIVIALLVGVMVLSSFLVKKPCKELKQSLLLVEKKWNTLAKSADLEYDNIRSWLPKVGVRGKYEIVKKHLSILILEKIVGENAFKSGPHNKILNLSSQTNFGHYNVKFLEELNILLLDLTQNDGFVKNVQSIYDQELKNYLRTYFLLYEDAVLNTEVQKGYISVLKQQAEFENVEHKFLADPSYYLQEASGNSPVVLENENVLNYYELVTCYGFWIRRSIDGTSDEFYKLLNTLMETFDPEFLEL